MVVEHIIFLIHPGCYEALDPNSPLHRSNIGIYVDREREVTQCWLAELARISQPTLLLQLYGPKPLYEQIKGLLGEAQSCYVHAEFDSIPPGPGQLREYYVRLTACIREHMRRYDLSFDATTVTSEIWGESLEGCGSLYSSAFAGNLGLKLKPRMRFEMMVYDTRFLRHSGSPQIIELPGTDIEALLFHLYDDTSAAIFQTRLRSQFYDERDIQLQLDPGRVQICNTRGATLWPAVAPRQAAPQPAEPYNLRTGETKWVRGMAMGVDELRDVVKAAKVGG